MNKDNLLALFHKYGFYSLNKEPFLYEKNDVLGICYSFKDPFYGVLTRVYLPDNLISAEDFLKKYYWFRKNGQKYNVILTLDDYKIECPNVSFSLNNQDLTFTDMCNLKDNFSKDSTYIKKLKRTVNLLLEIIKEKFKIQTETYDNLIVLTNRLIESENKLNTLLGKEIHSLLEKNIKENDFNVQINDYVEILNGSLTEKQLEEMIYTFTDYLKSLESDKSYLKNKYDLIKIPLQIKVVKEQTELLEGALKKKKNFLNKKNEVQVLLDGVMENSTLKNIVNFEHYFDNEVQRIAEKYSVIKDLDLRTVGDYLMEFDNLKIKEPVYEDISVVSFEKVMESLEVHFKNLSKDEQDYLIGFAYLMKKDAFDVLNFLKNPNNIMIRIKYFKDIDLGSLKKCEDSIAKFLAKIKFFNPVILMGDINVFWIDEKEIRVNDFLKCSSKRSVAPVQGKGENDCFYIGKLIKGSRCFYVPSEIVEDIYNEGSLILQENKPLILVDLEKTSIKQQKNDIIKVVYYETDDTMTDIKIVNDLKRSSVKMYKNVSIERILHE